MKKLIVILGISLLILLGCTSQEEKDRRVRRIYIENMAIFACLSAGGIPVFSFCCGDFKDCIFPPKDTVHKTLQEADVEDWLNINEE